MKPASESPIDFAAAQAAAEWFALLGAEDASDADRARWRTWLHSDPEHQRAWLRVEAIGRQFQRLPQPTRQVLERAGDGRRRALKMLMLAGATTTLAWSGVRLPPWSRWNADVGTRVGEIQESVLSDGSRLWLNTASAAGIDYSNRLRRIEVREGEILIDTARDDRVPPRPLVVDTRHGRLRALGTRFSVWQEHDATRLAVFEGAVEIRTADGLTRILESGRQLRYSRDAITDAGPTDVNREAWTRGVLLADDLRLDDFIAELARHQRGHIASDPHAGGLRLVGAYPLAEPDRVLAALEGTLPVRVRRVLPWWTAIEALDRPGTPAIP